MVREGVVVQFGEGGRFGGCADVLGDWEMKGPVVLAVVDEEGWSCGGWVEGSKGERMLLWLREIGTVVIPRCCAVMYVLDRSSKGKGGDMRDWGFDI